MKSILLVKRFLGLVEMTSGLVNASFSLFEWRAVKMIFYVPWSLLEIKGLIGNWFCVRLVLLCKIRLLLNTFFSFSTVMNSNYFAFNGHGFGCYIIMYNSLVFQNTANRTQRDFYEEVDLLTRFKLGNCVKSPEL